MAWEAATGWRSHALVQADTVRSLRDERQRLRSANTDLDRRNRALQSNLDEALDAVTRERLVAASMADELARFRNERVLLRGSSMTRREAVRKTTEQVGRRISVSASRNIASMPGEAVPYIGAVVIVAVTGLELWDLCETLKDLEALNLAFNPDDAPSQDRTTVCALEVVPTAQELMLTVKDAPKAAWNTTKSFVSDLPDLSEIQLPDIDYAGVWASTVDGTVNLGGSIKSGATSATDATLGAISGGWQNAKEAASGLFED